MFLLYKNKMYFYIIKIHFLEITSVVIKNIIFSTHLLSSIIDNTDLKDTLYY